MRVTFNCSKSAGLSSPPVALRTKEPCMPAPPDLSPLTLLLHADPVVQAVMALLLPASLACWAIILDKAVTLRRLAKEARQLAVTIDVFSDAKEGLAGRALHAGHQEWREGRDPAETAGEFRARVE